MKATFTKKIAVLCLSAVMALGVGVGVAGIKTAEAASFKKYDFTKVNSSYVVNTYVSVTDDVNATGVVFKKTETVTGGAQATIDSITYPSGIVRKVEDSLWLDELGKYSISYKSVVGAETTIYYEEFIVNNEFLNSLTGSAGVKNSIVDPTKPGVTVELKDGNSASFNAVVDLNNRADDGFVKLLTYSAAIDYTKVKNFTITITDALDSSNYVQVVMETVNNGIATYFRAGTSQLPSHGLTPSSGQPFNVGGRIGTLVYVDGERYLNYNYAGTNGLGVSNISIFYNPVNHRIGFSVPSFDRMRLIGDLDLQEAYPKNSKVFKGFSSNEVYISLSASNFVIPNPVTGTVFELGTLTGSQLEAQLDQNVVYDNAAPTISVDCKETVAGAVYAKLGKDFVIPTATAVDANGASEVSYKVYKNYTATSKTYVSFDSQKRSFKLVENVPYTIEYTATDSYGNLAVKTLKVVPVVSDTLTGGDIIVDDNIRFAANKFAFVSGAVCNTPIFNTFDSLNDDNARELTLTITKGDEVVYDKYFTARDFIEGVPALGYQPVSIGEYTVTYKYNDNINSDSVTYTITATSNNVVNYTEQPLLLRNYVAGMTYQKPDFTAYMFANDVTAAATTVSYSYDDGANWTVINGDSYKIALDKTQIKFKYSSAGATDIITDNAPIVDVRRDDAIANGDEVVLKTVKNGPSPNLDVAKYFTGDFTLQSVAPANEMRFVSNVRRGTNKLSFINPLTFDDANLITIAAKTETEFADYESITFIFTDAYDPTNQLRVKYEVMNNETNIIINDETPYLITTKLHGTAYNVKYNIANKRVNVSNINFSVDWQPKNNLFYFDLELGGLKGSYAGVIINTISNQKFTTATKNDNSKPILNFISSAGTYPVGSDITIYKPNCLDILTPFIFKGETVKVKVTLNKKPVTDVNGVLLDGTQDPNKDYIVKLAEFATYKVDYYIYDQAGNEYAKTYRFTGSDTNKPVITLGYGFTENTIHNVTLGKPFTISYDVTDDYTIPEKLIVAVKIIHDDDMRVVYTAQPQETITQDSDLLNLITDTCTITRKGMYTVYIYAADEASNTAYAKYKLNVQ